MHLKRLKLSRFRSCHATEVEFDSALTVLVGENNGGKSNIVDAIRLVTNPLSGRRDRFADDEDIRRAANPANFEIEALFADLSEGSKGLLVSALPDPAKSEAIFGMRYEKRAPNNVRGRVTRWAGQYSSNEPEQGSTDLVRHVFLPPLRDAHHALGSSGGGRLLSLFRQFLTSEADEQKLLAELARASVLPDVIQRMTGDVAGALGELTSGVRRQATQIGFSEATLFEISRDLRFKLGDAGVSLDDIRSSGLGYSNLLFMATVVIELTKARDADLTIFLVEEPEAHLHPQLQQLVLNFLLERARLAKTQVVPAGQSEGRIQVIVTTHSPNLAAGVAPEHLVVIRTQPCDESPPGHTVGIPVAKLGLSQTQLEKLDRYINVTRSSLLFGNRAILVEGIAEALLLPVVADEVLKSDREALLRFRGTAIVPIEGVDFAPYVRVLLTKANDARIADRLVVITDGDPDAPGDRVAKLKELARSLGSADALIIESNTKTLEHELFASGNAALVKAAYCALRQNGDTEWATEVDAAPEAERADKFLALFHKKRIRKGDFAQELCRAIVKGDHPFTVPPYLEKAIQAAFVA